MSSGRNNLFSALFISLFSILIAFSALKLGLGTVNDPDAGFLPFVVAICLLILSGLLILKSLKKEPASSTPREPTNYRRTSFIIAILFGYSLLIDILGFYLISFVFIFILFLMESRKALRFAFFGGIIVIICVYMLFEFILGVYFPRGILTQWIR